MSTNLHSVHSSGQPLCVLCKQCKRRAALTHDEIDAHSGNMKELRDLKLHCRNCGSKDYEMYVYVRAERVSDFLAGTPVENIPGECVASIQTYKPPKGSIADPDYIQPSR